MKYSKAFCVISHRIPVEEKEPLVLILFSQIACPDDANLNNKTPK